MPLTNMAIRRPVPIRMPRALTPLSSKVPGSQYANVVNLQSPVGAVNSDPTDYIGQLGQRISSDIATLRANHSSNIDALLKTIQQSQSNWKPNVPNLPPLTVRVTGNPSAPQGVKLSGGVDQWIAQAYKILGIPLTAKALADERYLIQHESGGNPNAVNRTPAGIRAGLPKGLEQVVGGTFAAYALPGHGNVFNPIDNIIASLRYRKSRYKTYNIGRYSGGY